MKTPLADTREPQENAEAEVLVAVSSNVRLPRAHPASRIDDLRTGAAPAPAGAVAEWETLAFLPFSDVPLRPPASRKDSDGRGRA